MSGSEHWMFQGRQEHGWFGHGTAPEGEAGANRLFDPRNAADRVDYAATGLIGDVPRGERGLWSASLGDVTRDRLKTAVAAWYGARELSRAAFEARLLDPYTSDETVDRLRRAARMIVEGRSYDDLSEACDDLSAAARQMGPDRWPKFVADAQRRAIAAVTEGQVPGVIKADADVLNFGLSAVTLGAIILTLKMVPHSTEAPQTPPAPDKSTTFQNAPPGEEKKSVEAPDPELAKPGEAVLTEERRKYILDGNKKGNGGHGTGRNKPDKSEFPPRWSDEEAIEAVKEVANDPSVGAICNW